MSKYGFTLLEVLITIVVITVGTTSLLSAFSRAIFISGTTSDLSIATSLAQAKMEQLRNEDFDALNNEPRTEVSGFPKFYRTVEITSLHLNLRQAVVTVDWDTKGGQLSKSFSTYIVRKNN